MSIDSILSLLKDFDFTNFIPELDTLLGKLELAVRIAVMVGPLVLLGLGIWYFFLPPKEANHHVGFRTYWGMSSVPVWRFTQRIAGMTWGVLGLLLTIIMFFISNGFRGMEAMDMVWSGFTCLMWQLGLIAVSTLGINIAVIVLFDADGNRRKFEKK